MSLNRFLGENYGSLVSIKYAASWWFKKFDMLPDGTIPLANIEFYDGKGWEDIYCTEDTMGYRQTQGTDANGDTWTNQIVGFHPGDEDATEMGLRDLHNKQQYVVMGTRPHGGVKIFGTPGQPLSVKLDSNSQTSVPGRAGTNINFNGITHERALILLP